MPFTEYLIGFAYFLGTSGAVTLACVRLMRRAFGHLSGIPRVLCFALLVVTGLIGVHMVAGILTILDRASVLVIAVVASAIVWLWASRRPPVATPEPEPSTIDAPAPEGALTTTLAALAVAAIVVYVLGFVLLTRNQAVSATDALAFHIPGVARWIQTKSFWHVQGTWGPGFAFGNYPHNGNVVQLAFMLPWNNDALVRFVAVPFLGLAGLSGYAIAREIGASRATAAIGASVLCSMPTAILPALENAQTDTFMLATFGIGMLFLIRYAHGGRRSELVLAGLGLGLALGSKWYAVPYVAIVLAVWGVASLAARIPLRRILRDGTALTLIVLAAGGFWLVRNAVQSGSPLFPAKVGLGNVTIFDAPRDPLREAVGFSVSHYFARPSIFRHTIVPQLTRTFGFGGPFLVVTLLCAVTFVVLRLRNRRDSVLTQSVILGASGILILIAYVFTPFSALGAEGRPTAQAGARYALPALLIAAALGAWAARGAWRAAFVGLGVLAVADGMRRIDGAGYAGLDLSPRLVVYGIGAAAGIGATIALLAWIVRAPGLARRSRSAAAIAALLALISAAVAGGHRQQRAYEAARYRSVDPVIDWVTEHAPSDHRIGLAGTWSPALPPALPLHGPRLRNTVVYVGPFVRGLLQRHPAQGPFVADLARGRYDLLVVGLGFRPGGAPQEELWAESAGFTEIVRSPRFVLLAAPGVPG